MGSSAPKRLLFCRLYPGNRNVLTDTVCSHYWLAPPKKCTLSVLYWLIVSKKKVNVYSSSY